MHRPLTLPFLILHFHTEVGCDSCQGRHFQQLLSRRCQQNWKQCRCCHWYCRENCYTDDVPWLLNSTITSYTCHCRALVHSRCAMSAKLHNQLLFLLLQSTGAQQMYNVCQTRQSTAIPAIAEHWCTVDVPWLLNSTMNSYPCYCRALHRCTIFMLWLQQR